MHPCHIGLTTASGPNMSAPKRSDGALTSQPRLCGAGQTPTKSKASVCLGHPSPSACTVPRISTDTSEPKEVATQTCRKRKRKTGSTPESVPLPKRPTLQDRSKISPTPTQAFKWPETWLRGSTSRGRGLKPFWDESSRVMSARLWSCTETDFVDTGKTCSNTFLANLAQTSSCTINARQASDKQQMLGESWRTTFWPSLRSSLLATTAAERRKVASAEKKKKLQQQEANDSGEQAATRKKRKRRNHKGPAKVHRVRIQPTKEQKRAIDTFFGVSRTVYNLLVDEFHDRMDSHINELEAGHRRRKQLEARARQDVELNLTLDAAKKKQRQRHISYCTQQERRHAPIMIQL